jgi:ATP-dependent Clp protease protease subunit
MAVNHEFYDSYLSSGFDVRNRRIFLYGEINEVNIGMLIKALYILESNNAEKPIEIIISSEGGDECEMLAAYDAIVNCKCHVVTIGIGKVMSAAPLILAAGDERMAFSNTSFMIHENSYGLEDKHTNIKATVKFYNDSEIKWCELMAKHTNLTAKQWKNKYDTKADQYFTAQQALKYGVIDKIIGE